MEHDLLPFNFHQKIPCCTKATTTRIDGFVGLLSGLSAANHDFGGKIGYRRLDHWLLSVGIVQSRYLQDR